MKTCREWEQAIVEYVDGTCEPQAARELEAHLARCAACAQAVRAQQWLKQALTQLERDRAPAYLSRRIRDHARVALWQRARARRTLRLAAAVTVVTAMVVGWWGVSRLTPASVPAAEEQALAQAILQEYAESAANDGFADPSLQLLAREVHLRTSLAESRSP